MPEAEACGLVTGYSAEAGPPGQGGGPAALTPLLSLLCRCPHHTLLQLPDPGSHLTPEVYSLPEAFPETTGALTGPTGLCPGLSLPWLGHQGPMHGLLCPQLLSLECGLVRSETELASPQGGLSPRPHGRPKDGLARARGVGRHPTPCQLWAAHSLRASWTTSAPCPLL